MDGPFHVVQVTRVDLVEAVALQTFEESAYDLVAVEPPETTLNFVSANSSTEE